MKTTTKKMIILTMVLTLPMSAFARGHATKEEKIHNKVVEAKQILKSLEGDYISRLKHKERREAIKKMNRVINLLNKIDRIEQDREKEYKKHPKPVYKPQPMSNSEFSKYYRNITKLRSNGLKLKYIAKTASNKNFSVDQLITVMKLFPSDNEKLDVTRSIYPYVVNKHKSFRLFRQMKHSSSMDRMERILNKYD